MQRAARALAPEPAPTPYIAKPFSLSELARLVRRTLDGGEPVAASVRVMRNQLFSWALAFSRQDGQMPCVNVASVCSDT
jgi:hypothetical protein